MWQMGVSESDMKPTMSILRALRCMAMVSSNLHLHTRTSTVDLSRCTCKSVLPPTHRTSATHLLATDPLFRIVYTSANDIDGPLYQELKFGHQFNTIDNFNTGCCR